MLKEGEPIRQLVIVRVLLLAPPHKVPVAVHEVSHAYVAYSSELLSNRLLFKDIDDEIRSWVVCLILNYDLKDLTRLKATKLRVRHAVPKEPVVIIGTLELCCRV